MRLSIALVPHACPPDRVRIWTGVTGVRAAPVIAWKLGDVAAQPVVVRAFAPVLEGAGLPAGAAADDDCWTGIVEFTGLEPSKPYRVEAAIGGLRIIRVVRTLPVTIPPGPDERFNVLLASCFDVGEDKTGTAGDVLSRLKVRPDMTLLAGDQVYLDLPTLTNFRNDRRWLAERFRGSYIDNWFGLAGQSNDPLGIPVGFPRVLSLAPCAFVPDDHEFWNNYPFRTAGVQTSYTFEGRENWNHAAAAMYQAFQLTSGQRYGEARTIDIDPLSIFLLDARSQRDFGDASASPARSNAGDLLGDNGRLSLEAWADGLIAAFDRGDARYGMLVSGQSFFSAEAGNISGSLFDYEFADYPEDFRFMREQIERISAKGVPLILATGDVHWGRVLAARHADPAAAPVFEIISSPTSLVATIGIDQAKAAWAAIRGLAGSKNRWPRHSDPDKPAGKFGTLGQFSVEVPKRSDGRECAMRGNHAVMLRFARRGRALDVMVTYYSMSGDDAFAASEQWSTEFTLRSLSGA